ncbi:MAG: hypothetical protein KF691_01445 [Phycisphaeraceae bacterium]|nr:hypothetical protein [Phycisphaeraceae bacterium]
MKLACIGLGLITAALVGCAGVGTSSNELIVTNDSPSAVEALVWAGDALPPDPETPVKKDQAIAKQIDSGGTWRLDLPARSGETLSASSVIATVAVRAQDEDLGQSRWINIEGPRPWMIRVFGEAPNLRVARVLQQDDTGRMQRTVGVRPPPVGSTGGLGSGPQR